MRVSRRAAAVAALLFLVACVELPVLSQLATEIAIAPAEESPLDLATVALEERSPGQSAFRLVVEGNEAFVSRMQSARMAARSLDVQSYIWHADVTGRYLAQELLLAADRGVRVRVLLDDLDARQHNDAIAALSLDDQYGPAHDVELVKGGRLHRIAGTARICVNSLHWQGIRTLAPGLTDEARASDGLIEAFSVRDAKHFVIGVQWHPEWQVVNSPFSCCLFAEFGAAARSYARLHR